MVKDKLEDFALEVLIQSRADIAPELSEDLVRHCYFIQKNNQFNVDRSIAMVEMEKAIDAEVERVTGEAEDQG